MKIREFYKKHEEIILYIVYGLLTTVVAFVTYLLVTKIGAIWFHDENGDPSKALQAVAVFLKWFFAVIVSFYTNKYCVFKDNAKGAGTVGKQFVAFTASRVATLLLDMAMQFVFLWLVTLTAYKTVWIITPDLIARLCSEVVVVIVNYFLSKLLIFKKKKDGETEKG